MTTTETKPRTLPVIDGWVVRDLPNGDQVRARLRVDEYGDTMEPERDGTGVLLVRERDSYHGIDLDEHDGLARVLDRIGHDGRYWYVSREDEYHERLWDSSLSMEENWARNEHDLGGEDGAREFVRRYLRAFWDVEDAFLFRHQAYRDWADIWVITERSPTDGAPGREFAEGIAEEWSDWAKGDVYWAEAEYRTLADAMEAEDFEDGWTHHDTLHGGIGDGGALSVLWQVLCVSGYGDVAYTSLPKPYEVTK